MVEQRIVRRLPAAVLLACFIAGGCAGGKLTAIKDEEDFRLTVLEADKPVLVDFYKGGCPTCLMLDPGLDQLAEEYEGRVVLAKFQLMTAYLVTTSVEIKKKYDLAFFPTVLLFVDGEEKQRWVMHYEMDDYRKALDEVAGPPVPVSPGGSEESPAASVTPGSDALAGM